MKNVALKAQKSFEFLLISTQYEKSESGNISLLSLNWLTNREISI